MTADHENEEKRLLKASNALTVSLIHVIFGATIIAGFVLLSSSLANSIEVSLGLHHYAESLSPFSTAWLPMPFNTIVNVGYLVTGIFWIRRIRSLLHGGGISADEAYLMYVFSWMIIVYGHVQLVRIVSHWRVAGILDQWYTLPIFAWVGVSCREIGRKSGGLGCWTMASIMTTSVLSYGLAAIHACGFEVALAAHIGAVIVHAWWLHRKASTTELGRLRRLAAFVRALMCCLGFVSLKLADWHLVHLLPTPFAVLTGHFWSKVADFMQAHYACRFLEAALPSRSHLETASDHKLT